MAEALRHPACVALPDAMATVKFSAQGAGAGCGLVLQMEFDGLPLDLRELRAHREGGACLRARASARALDRVFGCSRRTSKRRRVANRARTGMRLRISLEPARSRGVGRQHPGRDRLRRAGADRRRRGLHRRHELPDVQHRRKSRRIATAVLQPFRLALARDEVERLRREAQAMMALHRRVQIPIDCGAGGLAPCGVGRCA